MRGRGSLLVAFLTAGCLQAGPQACSDRERMVFDSIRHFQDLPLEAQDHASGACVARFRTTDPDAVLGHYARELLNSRWLVGPRGLQPDGSPVELPPNLLHAQRNEFSFTLEIVEEGTDSLTVTVLVGEDL